MIKTLGASGFGDFFYTTLMKDVPVFNRIIYKYCIISNKAVN